jgi:hypothetical protein
MTTINNVPAIKEDNEVTAVEENLPNLPVAISSVAKHLEHAVGAMNADVVSLELSADANGARLKSYAYKHKATDRPGS